MSELPILIIEDDPAVVESVARLVEDLGYSWQHTSDGKEGLERSLTEQFVLVIVDLGLPSLGGLEICRQLREKRPLQPILILTGEGGETNTVLGLELGADDYLQKPVRPMELRARIRALLRRAAAASAISERTTTNRILQISDIEIDVDAVEVRVAGKQVELTQYEFEILLLLVENPNRVFSREAIVTQLWGDETYSDHQNIRNHISRLRQKLDCEGSQTPYIITKRGFGYQFRDPESSE